MKTDWLVDYPGLAGFFNVRINKVFSNLFIFNAFMWNAFRLDNTITMVRPLGSSY